MRQQVRTKVALFIGCLVPRAQLHCWLTSAEGKPRGVGLTDGGRLPLRIDSMVASASSVSSKLSSSVALAESMNV